MLLSDESSIKKHIKSSERASVYFIYGDESYLASFYANSLASSVTDTSGAGFNYYFFNSETADFDPIYEACETLPVMSERSCVFVKDLPFGKLDADTVKRYTDYFPSLPDTVVLIFLMDNVEAEDLPGSKWRQVIDAVNKNGVVFKLSKRSENAVAELLVRSATTRNASIDKATADYFLSVVGNDMQVILNEFDKLCAYADGVITTNMVDEIAVRSVEASVFDLTDAVNSRKGDSAFEILTELIKNKTDPTLIIGTVAFSYVDIYRARAAMDAGERNSVFLSAFGSYKNKSFRLDKAAKWARKFTAEQIKDFVNAVAEADIKIKSFSMDNNVVLEELVARLLYIAGGAG